MKTNLEIYNYLNIINRRVGKMYKLTGICPLPKDFVADEDEIKRILFLKQMENKIIFPEFIFNNKKIIKNYFQMSLYNCKKLKKKIKNINFSSSDFRTQFLNYLSIRIVLTRFLLKDFRGQEIDETSAYQELFNLDPIFGELLNKIYMPDFDFDDAISNIEEKYQTSYMEKLKKINKKERKKRAQKNTAEIQPKIQKTQKKVAENVKKPEKKVEKVKKAPISAEKSKTTKQTKMREK